MYPVRPGVGDDADLDTHMHQRSRREARMDRCSTFAMRRSRCRRNVPADLWPDVIALRLRPRVAVGSTNLHRRPLIINCGMAANRPLTAALTATRSACGALQRLGRSDFTLRHPIVDGSSGPCKQAVVGSSPEVFLT